MLPPALTGHVEVVLAHAAETLDTVPALPGGPVYEPKWDGYRLVVARDDPGAGGETAGGVRLWSRQHTNLTGAFPDLAAAVAAMVPAGTVLDGEVVTWSEGRLRFDLLGRRLATGAAGTRTGVGARRLAAEVAAHPVTFLAFDVLAVAGHDVRARPWRERRALLEELAAGWQPPVQLTPYTTDREVADRWLREYRVAGVEGLVVKGTAGRYVGGRRDWVKVKYRDTHEVVVGAVTGPVRAPQTLIAGLYRPGGRLRIVGRSTPVPADAARELGAVLTAATDAHPWPTEISSGVFGRPEKVAIVRVEPRLVVEVSGDTAVHAGRFRHPVRYLRLRPDLDPADLPLLPDH